MEYNSPEEKIIFDRLATGLAKPETGTENVAGKEIERHVDGADGTHYEYLTLNSDECMRILSTVKDVTPYTQLRSGRKATGWIVELVRRIVRKLTFWYVVPQAEQQLEYNNVVVSALGYSNEKQELLSGFQKETDRKISGVNMQIDNIRRQLNKMLKRNELSDILDAWEHDYL